MAVVTAAGSTFPADLVIGADGARSTVRADVDPERPDGRYAGVLLWRAMVDEQAMPGGVRLPPARRARPRGVRGPLPSGHLPRARPGGRHRGRPRRLNLVGTTRSKASYCGLRVCLTARPSTAAWHRGRCPAMSGSGWLTSRLRAGPARGGKR